MLKQTHDSALESQAQMTVIHRTEITAVKDAVALRQHICPNTRLQNQQSFPCCVNSFYYTVTAVKSVTYRLKSLNTQREQQQCFQLVCGVFRRPRVSVPSGSCCCSDQQYGGRTKDAPLLFSVRGGPSFLQGFLSCLDALVCSGSHKPKLKMA